MRRVTLAAAVLLTAGTLACNRETVTEKVSDEAADQLQERNRDQADLEKRAADLELKWNEMQARVQDKNRAPTTALRNEIAEDVTAVREAVAKLKTTTPDNWWERQEEAARQTVDDIEADVRRFSSRPIPPVEPSAAPVGTASRFDQQRAELVDRARARLDAFEAQLKDVKVKGAMATELDDTRARIEKARDDLDRLRSVEPGDWWDISEKRVSEYIDRVNDSIGRLDNDKAPAR